MEQDILEPGVDNESEVRYRTQTTASPRKTSSFKTHAPASSLQNVGEFTPLLGRHSRQASSLGSSSRSNRGGQTGNEWPGQLDFEGKPWHKRPSIYWMLPPFFIFTLAFGGTVVPKLNLIADMVCHEFYADKSINSPIPPSFMFGGTNDRCMSDDVQRDYTRFTMVANLIGGLFSALTSPKLGALSDRYGRKLVMCASTAGMLAGEVITIVAGSRPDTFSVYWFYLGYLLDGICGSFTACIAIAHSYAADCTPPSRRNVAFGYFQGVLFTGIAIGPFLAGQIIRITGTMLSIFYVALACHLTFILCLLFVIPESLSEERQQAAREKYEKEQEGIDHSWFRQTLDFFGSFFSPLKVLHPRGDGTSPRLRRNLFILCAIDTIAFGVGMGSLTVIVIYVRKHFGWTVEEQSNYVSIVNICRVFVLFVGLPSITRWVRGPAQSRRPQPQNGCDTLDLIIIRFAIVCDTLGYLGYALSDTATPFVLAGCFAALGGIGSPTIQSALTKHVPPNKTGELLGANGLLHALARVIAPLIFSGIYWLTLDVMPQAVFVCLTSAFGLAAILSLFVRSGVYLDPIVGKPTAGSDDGRDSIREE